MMSPYILNGDISKTFSLDTPNGDNMRRDLESLTPVIEGLTKKYAKIIFRLVICLRKR